MPGEPNELPIELFEVARREEARLARAIAEITDEARPFAGGIMACSAQNAGISGSFGAGHAGPVARDEVRALVEFFEHRGIAARIELTPFAHSSLCSHLGAERFALRRFENVWFRPLARTGAVLPPQPALPELTIRPVDPADDADVDRFARASLQPDIPNVPDVIEAVLHATRRAVRHPRCISLVAELGAHIAGTAALELGDGIATLFAMNVAEPYRRRGIQQAMIAWRLQRASQAGADLATITSVPGIPTERNARRLGFQLAYTKVLMVRPVQSCAAHQD